MDELASKKLKLSPQKVEPPVAKESDSSEGGSPCAEPPNTSNQLRLEDSSDEDVPMEEASPAKQQQDLHQTLNLSTETLTQL